MSREPGLAPDARIRLAAVAGRVREWDPGAVVRVVTRGSAVAVFAEAPMGVLVFLAVPMIEPLDEQIDRGVSVARLRDVLGNVESPTPDSWTLKLPDERDLPPALAVLPTPSGWIAAERATAAEVNAAFDQQMAAARQGLADLGDAADGAAVQALIDDWWARPSWGGLPLKALHAARSLGMLGHSGIQVESATRAGWKRLVTPTGQVFAPPPAHYSGIPLTVV